MSKADTTIVQPKEVHWRTAKLNNDLLAVQPEICIERARLITQSYKETEADPMIISPYQCLFTQRDYIKICN